MTITLLICVGLLSQLACNHGPCEGGTYPPPWAADLDDDGYGVDSSLVYVCNQPAGYVSIGGDCDGGDPARNPGVDEICNGTDDNCDGDVDESTAVDAPLWFRDADADGYGDPDDVVPSCTQPDGRVDNDRDCDDGDGATHPNVVDDPNNGVDDDCDGGVDEATLWAADVEGGQQHTQSGRYGSAVAVADLDGDGAVDLVVGAPTAAVDDKETQAGAVWIHSQKADWFMAGQSQDDQAGAALVAGDLNADGYDDLVVAADHALTVGTDAGALYVLYGPVTTASALNARRDHKVKGDDPFDLLGGSLDLSDGLMAVGAPVYDFDGQGTRSGGVYLISSLGEDVAPFASAVASAVVAGVEGGDRIGTSVALGDVDGDGLADLVTGGSLANQRTQDVVDTTGGVQPVVDPLVDVGAAWLVIGPLSGAMLVDDARGLFGAAELDAVGTAVAILDDLDGDGLRDVAVGAPGDDAGGEDAGAVFFLPGGDWQVAATWLGELAGAGAGTSLDARHDVDGDGRLDLLVGAPGQATVHVVASEPAGVVLLGGASVTVHGDAGSELGAAAVADPSLGLILGAPGSDETWSLPLGSLLR